MSTSANKDDFLYEGYLDNEKKIFEKAVILAVQDAGVLVQFEKGNKKQLLLFSCQRTTEERGGHIYFKQGVSQGDEVSFPGAVLVSMESKAKRRIWGTVKDCFRYRLSVRQGWGKKRAG